MVQSSLANMCLKYFVCLVLLYATATDSTPARRGTNAADELQIVTREEWGAKPPKAVDPMTNPVPYVVIHHSYVPPVCNTGEQCVEAMHWMQDFHQDNRSWNDIGYGFAVGGDGRAYEGRGWSRVAAHAPTYNDKSIGICVIGDWRENLPGEAQLTATKRLIRRGVELGMIAEDYILVTHRQVRAGTECPGDRLFREVSTWDRFHAADDLYVYVPPDVVADKDPAAVAAAPADPVASNKGRGGTATTMSALTFLALAVLAGSV